MKKLLNQFGTGFSSYGKATTFIFKNGLWYYFIFPLLFNILLFAEFNLSNENIGEINMPNKDGFLLPDPRPDVASFEQSICMNDCDAALKVIGRARDLDVTPEDEN